MALAKYPLVIHRLLSRTFTLSLGIFLPHVRSTDSWPNLEATESHLLISSILFVSCRCRSTRHTRGRRHYGCTQVWLRYSLLARYLVETALYLVERSARTQQTMTEPKVFRDDDSHSLNGTMWWCDGIGRDEAEGIMGRLLDSIEEKRAALLAAKEGAERTRKDARKVWCM